MGETPDYSGVSSDYASVRPTYPAELFDWLASLLEHRDMAWDTATGSGQAALGLVPHFDRVIATDLSAAQLQHARRHPRIEYRVACAEKSGLDARSVDLVVVAAALHWFDLDRFYAEVSRVVRSGGLLAAWTYHVAHVGPPLDRILWPFYTDMVAQYFAAGARMVDARYEGLALPGQVIRHPEFQVSVRWSADDVLRFVKTWSGVQSCIKETGKDPVAEIVPAIREVFGDGNPVRELNWPLYLRVARQG